MGKFTVTLFPSEAAQGITGIEHGLQKDLEIPNDESIAIIVSGWIFQDWRWCAISGGTAVFLHDEDPQKVG